MTQEGKTADRMRAAMDDAHALLSAWRDLNTVEDALIMACRKTAATGKTYSQALAAGLPEDDSLGVAQSAHYEAQAELAVLCQRYAKAYECFDASRRNPEA